MVRHYRLAARSARAGCCPGTKKTPHLCGRSARRESPVALVDNDGGGSHERPCVAHDSSVARPSTIWLPSLELWSPRHHRCRVLMDACRAVLGIPHTRPVSQSRTRAARHERTPETPDPEMPYSAAREAFVDDLLFAVVEVRIDEGQPLAVIS